MKRIVVVSDSHGQFDYINAVIKQEQHFEIFVHCGDGVNDMLYVDLPERVSKVLVSGNVDRARGVALDSITQFVVDSFSILVTHGDQYGVKNSYDQLLQAGIVNNFDLILFGHTHLPMVQDNNSNGAPVLFNPGTIRKGSYGVISVGATLICEHRHLSM